jgi:superfamily II DNA or RNA helicase
MATFPELRDRFSNEEHKRGKQFERVCKWFLETDLRYSERLVNVWLWDDWPGRWGPDCGIDLVAQDRDGKNWAIQAKCYDPKYSVTKSDVDKFLSESTNENIHHRLLIATTDHLGKNARNVIHRGDKVIPVSQILLAGLETAPVVWPSDPARLKGGGARKPVKRWPHQTEAINNVTKNLGKRGQMISACGTGKTLAALWISERLEAKRTLVLLPSLTLLSQTVSEWLANTKEPFAYLPVCSDDTVSRGNDAAVLFTSDLEFPVTTNPDDIATFLRKRVRQVVFSTYQSSHQIAEAQTHNSVPGFDLVIADEAHRCAGKVSSVYGTVLDDEAIRAKKRLFMTATPRTYTARVQKKAREAEIEIASMDDEAVFGPVVHQLNFGEAIEKGLLSDYQVVVVGVDNSRYKQMVDKRRIVKADRDIKTDAETLAKHVALVKAIRDYGLRRTISFHSRINTASEFANMLPKVVSWMPPRHRPEVEIVTDHVSGKMSTGERNRRLNRLRNLEPGQSAVLTNAQCLSEGIDVPSLDGVAFIDPRRSEVDIVQAVGRAIRRSEDKTIGTIVIPVFLSGTDDPDTALSQSEFEPVWSIVRALRSHDDTLGEALDGIRFEMGRKGGGGKPPKPIVFDIPKGISRKFAGAFATRLVEATTSSWNFNLGLLQNFVDREGHAQVPATHAEPFEGGEFRLGGWVSENRSIFSNGRLSQQRIKALEAVPGWVWDGNEAIYQEGLAALQAFVDREGHARVSQAHVEPFRGNELNLGAWASTRRMDYRAGGLSSDRLADLEALPGWVWDPNEADFQEGLAALQAFVDREGHARVPATHAEPFEGGEFRLGGWVNSMRTNFKTGGTRSLSPERVAALEAVPGWVWDVREADFQEGLAALRAFVDREGHARVPAKHIESFEGGEFWLGRWVNSRRSNFRDGRLSPERIAAIEAVPGWIWNVSDADYQERLAALRAFVDREGHARVPVGHVEEFNGKKLNLSRWVSGQRTNYSQRNPLLTVDRIAVLEALPGWLWDAIEIAFQEGLAALRVFVDREGHARVPARHIEGGEFRLGGWVRSRRKDYSAARGRLSPERIAALEAIPGWIWNTREADYQEGLSALRAFVDREGHARIVQSHVEPFQGSKVNLGTWVTNRRIDFRDGKLSADEIEGLEAMEGWIWEPREVAFQEGLAALRAFVGREGHARVVEAHVERLEGGDFTLGTWVSNRRGNFNDGKLPSDWVDALEAIPGWVWDPTEADFQAGLAALRAFVDREGHARVPARHIEGGEFRLGSWVNNRRNGYREKRLKRERVAALEAIPEWVWSAR